MAVFRVEKNKNYTVMSNHHLRNMKLTLKAKGLLSQMLSLPPDWDYTLAGLAKINKEGIDAIREAVKELEAEGYTTRKRSRKEDGRFGGNEYVIREEPSFINPALDNPMLEVPVSDNPVSGNPIQLSKEELMKEELSKDMNKYRFYSSEEEQEAKADKIRKERDLYHSIILENIGYEYLAQEIGFRVNDLDEIVELMLDTICSSKALIRIGGEEMPKDIVKSRLLKLNSEHIRYVLDCMGENTTRVRNIRQYLLTTLYNAPVTISNYYSALVNHDMYGGGS